MPASPHRPPDRPAAPAPEVLELLTQQHRQLEHGLKALVDTEAGDERCTLLAHVADELAVHVGAEEVVFYPAVHAARTEDVLLESLEEHLSLKRLVADLLALAPADETFSPKCKVLQEQTEHHHREEEEHLFPQVRRLLDEPARRELGERVRAHEDGLRQADRPRQALPAQTEAAQPLEGAGGGG